MSKVGRNDPCPCGSGRKYKKCCVDEKKPAQVANHTQPQGFSVHPYTMVRIAEDPRSAGKNLKLLAEMQRSREKNWTRAKVAALSTEEIEDQLIAYGVRYSRDRFLGQAAKSGPARSAWRLGDEWLRDDSLKCRGKEEDFLGLAACELWKRLIPGEASFEQVLDWMLDGYDHLQEDRNTEACELWWRVWETLKPRLKPTMKTVDETAAIFPDSVNLFNWSQDFEMQLANAANTERRSGSGDTLWASRGESYCRDWIRQFADEDVSPLSNFRTSLADFLFLLGRGPEAQACLLEIVAKWPENPWGYVAIADAHSHMFAGISTLPLDFDEALRWLDLGLARLAPGHRHEEILEERKAELLERRLSLTTD